MYSCNPNPRQLRHALSCFGMRKLVCDMTYSNRAILTFALVQTSQSDVNYRRGLSTRLADSAMMPSTLVVLFKCTLVLSDDEQLLSLSTATMMDNMHIIGNHEYFCDLYALTGY